MQRAEHLIREYRQADLLEVAKVWCESWNATGLAIGQSSLAEYQQRLASEAASWSIYVALANSTIGGFLAFQRPDNWLRQLFVSPSCQGMGIGYSFLEVAKREMSGGFWLRTDAANVVARRFYEKAGLALRELGTHPVHGQPIAIYVWSNSD